MVFIGRKTLKSERARTRHIDLFFERVAQVLLLSYMLFVVIAWISYRPALQVQSVAIEGVHGIDRSAVDTIVTEPLSWRFFSRVNRNNMFFYPRAQVLHRLEALDPRVANVKLRFDGARRLHVTLEEFSPSLLYCIQGGTPFDSAIASSSPDALGDCYFADARGYVFAAAPTWSGYPFFTIVASSTEQASSSPLGTFVLDQDEYVRLKSFFALLSEINIHPRIITMLGGNDFRVSTGHAWDILWTSVKDPQVSVDNLALMLRSLEQDPSKEADLRVVDLRFGNKIFYK
jgi:hypothetical protein